MNCFPFLALMSLLATPVGLVASAPLGTAFTYQGQLLQGSSPATGSYALRFTLFDAVTNGNTVAGPITNNAVVVANGLLTVVVDFGAPVFNGNAGWLEIAARTNGTGAAFVVLSPRQALAPVPNAQFAASAASAATASAVLSGSVSAGQLNTPANPGAGQLLVYNGTSLAWTNPGAAWLLGGNAGTVPGMSYLGTADNQPLELRANNQRVFRLEPGASGSPNVIGGSVSNGVASGTAGATIGGGATNLILAGAALATISGGYSNVIVNGSAGAVIAGGHYNSIGLSNLDAVITGGGYNHIGDYVYSGTVGGYGNALGWNAVDATVSGGTWNSVGDSAYESFIGGGGGNTNLGPYSVIAGGTNNVVEVGGTWNVVSGGANNYAGTGYALTIPGGYYNYIGASSDYSTIGGGYDHFVNGAPYSTIPGGREARTTSYGQMAYAAGFFANWGDAQTSLFVLRNQTTSTAQTELFLDGSASRMLVPTNATWTFQVLVVARIYSTGNSACFQASGGVKRLTTGTVSFVGTTTPTFTVLANDNTGLAVPTLVADTANGALDLKVTGLNAQTIRWVARVQTAEVGF